MSSRRPRPARRGAPAGAPRSDAGSRPSPSQVSESDDGQRATRQCGRRGRQSGVAERRVLEAAEGLRAHRGGPRGRDRAQAGATGEAAERVAIEVLQVAGQVELEPGRAEERDGASCRSSEPRSPGGRPGAAERAACGDRLGGVVDVLERVVEDDRRRTSPACHGASARVPVTDVDADALGMLGGRLGGLDAGRRSSRGARRRRARSPVPQPTSSSRPGPGAARPCGRARSGRWSPSLQPIQELARADARAQARRADRRRCSSSG